MTETLLVLGDGDNIRIRVEKLLFSGDLEGLAVFSRSLVDAIEEIAQNVRVTMGARVLVAAGDDVVFVAESEKLDLGVLQNMAAKFLEDTGSTISFGIGPQVEAAYVNLRRAKVSGGGNVVTGFDLPLK